MTAITIIGGEDRSSPARIKVYINTNNPDFSILDETHALVML